MTNMTRLLIDKIILVQANDKANEDERLPESELLGQMTTFIFAGHDTTTGAICRTLHQLVLNPDVQERLRAEVVAAREQCGGDLGYDVLMGLPYLDAICRETLRVFPPASLLFRVYVSFLLFLMSSPHSVNVNSTRKDITLPLMWPIKSADGKTEIKEIPLKKNTEVIMSILNANRCKAIWGEDAGEWKPERWLSPLPESVAKAHMPGVYASMFVFFFATACKFLITLLSPRMTFIGGGRACM